MAGGRDGGQVEMLTGQDRAILGPAPRDCDIGRARHLDHAPVGAKVCPAIGGAVLGIMIGFIAKLFARIGAKRRARKVEKNASDAVRVVADDLIITPMRNELAQRNELLDLLAVAAG